MWTVLGTAGAGAAVALLVDFFLKPRLQVRNERFSQRAKERMELTRVVRALMLEFGKGMSPKAHLRVPEDARPELLELMGRHDEERLEKIYALTGDYNAAYASASHHLQPPVFKLATYTGGLLEGLLLADVDMNTLQSQIGNYVNLLYDILMTSRVQVFAYRARMAWVRRVVGTGYSARQRAVLRLYRSSAFGS
jgi:hypothetical protein